VCKKIRQKISSKNLKTIEQKKYIFFEKFSFPATPWTKNSKKVEEKNVMPPPPIISPPPSGSVAQMGVRASSVLVAKIGHQQLPHLMRQHPPHHMSLFSTLLLQGRYHCCQEHPKKHAQHGPSLRLDI
jgi:hypothetical protein